jgi:hypothetical protein
MDLKETGPESVEWIKLAQNNIQGLAVVDIIMNFEVLRQTRYFLTS